MPYFLFLSIGTNSASGSKRIKKHNNEDRSDLIWFYPRQQSKRIQTNPKPSFYSESTRARIDPNRIFNQNQSEWIRAQNDSDLFWLKIWFGSIRTRVDSGWKLIFRLVRIHSDSCLGLNRIRSDRFFYRFSVWFGMIRIGLDKDIGMNRTSSDWLGMNSYPILSLGRQYSSNK